MKKTLTYISLSLGILLLSISALIVPNVLAQDASRVMLDLEVDSGCNWSGTPYAPTSSLTVYDNEVCYVIGENRAALNVTIQEDLDSTAPFGGKLIIGGSTTTKTNFTVGGTFTANGIVEIGQTGDSPLESSLITNGWLLKVSETGSNGIIDIIANSNGDNFIDVNNYTMTVGGPSTTGIFRNNDDSTSTIFAISLYGTFENLNAAGTITFDNADLTTSYFRSGVFNNDGIINTDSGDPFNPAGGIDLRGATNGDNSGTINITLGNLNLGEFFGSSTVTFNNTNEINITGSGGLLSDGNLLLSAGTEVTNTGNITTYHFISLFDSIFDNNSGGTLETDASAGVFWLYGSTSGGGNPTFTNNSGASVTAYGTWLTALDQSTGPSYTDTPIIENKNGATFTSSSMSFSFEDGGESLLGAQAYGGIFNNAGDLTISGTGNSLEIYVGGKLNNLAGGTIDLAGNIKMGTTDDDINMKGDCEDGTGPSDQSLRCTITNASTTGIGFRLNSTTAVINMYDYTKIDNTGGTMNVCNSTSCTSTSVVAINTNNTDIVNGTGGTMNLNGDLSLGYDAYLNSDGAINIKGNSSSTNLSLSGTAIFETKGATTFSGTYQKVIMDASSQLKVGSTGTLSATTATGANSTLFVKNTASVTNAGEVTFKGYVELSDTATITNDDSGAEAKFTIDDTSSYVNYLQVGIVSTDTPTFTNAAGGIVTIDGDATSGDGELRVYHGGLYENEGTTNTWYLNVGRHSGTITDGGTFTNAGTAGMVNVYSTSAAAATPALDLYRGQITNTSTYVGTNGSFYVRGYLYMLGTGTGLDSATFANSGAVYHTNNLYIYNYSTLDLNAGTYSRWVGTNTNNVYGSLGTEGKIEIEDGAIYGALSTNFNEYAILNNSGVMKRVAIQTGDQQNSNLNLTFNNTSTFNNTATGYIRTYTGTITLNNTPTFTNLGNVNYTGGVGEKYGFFNVYATNAITNAGTIYTEIAEIQNTTFNNTSIFVCSTLRAGTSDLNSTIFNNTGTFTAGNLYLGTATNRGSTFNNDGTATVTSTAYIYSPGIYTNYETRTSSITTILMYSGSTFENNGTLTGSNLHVGTASANTNILFNNNTTGTVTNNSYLYVYGNSTVVLNNYGIFGGNGLLQQGYQTSSTGGTINNYNSFTRNNGGDHSIHNGGVFNNHTDATATFAGKLQVGFQSGAIATYNQYARTSSSAVKTTINQLAVSGYGVIENNDAMQTNGGVSISDTFNNNLGEFNCNAGSTTAFTSASAVAVSGSMTIDEGASVSFAGAVLAYQGSGTTVHPIITVNGTITSGTSISVGNQASLFSGNNSSITLTGNPSISLVNTSPFAELAGNVSAHSIHANGLGVNNLSNGYLCIGDYQGAYPAGSCNNVATSAVTLTGANASSIYVSPYTDVASNTVTADIANNVTMAGGIKAQKGRATTSSAIINIYKDAIVTINGLAAEACQGTKYCAIDVGADNNAAGAAEINVYGTVNLSTTTGRIVGIGYHLASTGSGTLNIKSDAVDGNGLIYDYTNTQLIIDQYSTGKLNIERTDAANYGELYLEGTCAIKNNGEGTDGNRGANVNGKLRCYSNLTVASTGSMDVGRISSDSDRGIVQIEGSTTDIYGFTELDGLLDTGTGDGDTLTVYNLGTISSGVGTATNFEILAHDINVNSGGKIASDGVSESDSGSQGGGSYGGAGESRPSSYSYGASKMDETTVPVYGQAGHTVAAVDTASRGGGGVRIYSTGTITHNGEISADGGSTASTDTGAGAGGTVIIVHEPLATTDEFTGAGTITANGGHSTDSTSKAGGGGRIAIISPLLDDPDDNCAGSPAPHPHYQLTGTVSAYPGDGTAYAAAAGTIAYLGDVNNDDPTATVWGTLIVDQNNQTSLITTEISDSGDIDFARVEARNDAQVTYETNPVAPTSCFQIGTSTITGPTCNPNPDKPDVLYVGDSYTGVQQSACTGPEPSIDNPVDYLYDQTPVFSAFYRNPEDSTAVRYVAIQVSEDDPTFTTGLIWDTTIDLGATNTVTPGQRTRDIEFDEDSTATGSITPTHIYYVRMAFMDASNTYQGLWTHYDIGDHYNFEVLGNMTISDACSGSMTILDDNGVPNPNIRDVDGDRYGNAECTLTITSDSAAWSLFFGKAPDVTAFIDPTLTYTIPEIDNAGADCTIQSDGGSSAEPEYGFNISSAASLINNNVRTDASCSQAYNAWNQGTGNYVFNVENSTADNELVRVTSGGVTAGTDFTLNMHATVDDTIEPTSYSLDVRASVTTYP